MKLPPFDYACPTTLPEAIELLASHDGDAKAIAGGQSLVPMIAFRLAQPSLLVDLRKLADLRGIKISDATASRSAPWCAGATSRTTSGSRPRIRCSRPRSPMSRIIRSAIAARSAAALPMPIRRPRCPASPSTCDAEIAVVGKSGARVIQAADFFQGALTTALTTDEIIIEIRLPAWPAGAALGLPGIRPPPRRFRDGRRQRCSTIRTSAARRAMPMSASSASAIGRCG